MGNNLVRYTTSFSPVFHRKLILNVVLLISKGDSILSKLLKANVIIFGQFDAARILQFVPTQVSSFIL
jgi:hypothetical protein